MMNKKKKAPARAKAHESSRMIPSGPSEICSFAETTFTPFFFRMCL